MKTRSILLSGLVLAAFAVGGVALVSLTHQAVDSRIADNRYQAMKQKLDTILPRGRVDNDPLEDAVKVSARDLLGAETTQVYRARHGADAFAVVLEPVVPDGYAGPIQLLVSVLEDGTLGGVRVISHHETPGLGDKIEETKSDWILGMKGKSLENPPLDKWGVKRDGGAFDQFTGATITPRSVVNAVKNTLIYVKEHQDQLFTPQAASSTKTESQEHS